MNVLFPEVLTGACMEKKQRIVTDQNCRSETESKE